MSTRRMTSHPGRCRYCTVRGEVFSCSRMGGGSYRRAQRTYDSSLCGECAIGLLSHRSPGTLSTSSWSGSGVVSIVASLGTAEAAEVLTAWYERRDRARWMREDREARSGA